MLCRVLFMCVVCFHACAMTEDVEHGDHTEGIDPYESILEHLNITQNQFSLSKLDELVDDFLDHFHCENEVNKICNRSLCMDAEDIYTALGFSANHMLQEQDFEGLSNLLMYSALQISTNCHKQIALPATIAGTRSQLLKTITGNDSATEISALEFHDILQLLNVTYGDVEIDDETEGEHDLDHEESDGQQRDDEQEPALDQEEREMADENEGEENIDGELEHDIDHEMENEEEHEQDHDAGDDIPVTMNDCLSAGLLFDHLHQNPKQPMTSSLVDQTSAFIVHHIVKGSHISQNCRLLPRRWYFIDELYQAMNSRNEMMSQHDFEDLMEKLNLIQEETETVDDHEHTQRKKRAVDPPTKQGNLERTQNGPFMQTDKCFTGNELLAIYESADGVSKQAFNEICPSLIYQQISNSCQVKPRNNDTIASRSSTIAERYGYSTLANIIICLCSVIAAFFMPCASSSTYKVIMAIFLGLAVGTLTSDAFLHLLPMAFGVHGFGEDEHGHRGEKVVVEPFVLYALVGLAGIYAFYLLESVMSLVYGKNMNHGHSHGHSPTLQPENTIADKYDNTSIQITESYNSKSNLNIHEDRVISKGELSTDSVMKGKKRLLKPIAIMVILGDSIHNFADGLAMGAAFAHSVPTGVATSVTVLCHELPHELGDFAVLVSSGLSIFQAAMFNLLSSVTSFIGLYLGLAISTDETIRKWIFSAAAGMFLYIALVDMLPSLINSSGPGRKKQFFHHNIGILLGFVVLFLIAIFEERITL